MGGPPGGQGAAAPAARVGGLRAASDRGPGGGSSHTLPGHIEAFSYAVSGGCRTAGGSRSSALGPGCFAFLRPGTKLTVGARKECRLLWLKKIYEPLDARRAASL